MSKSSMSDLLSLEDEGSSKKKGFLGGLFNRNGSEADPALNEDTSLATKTTVATLEQTPANPALPNQETLLDLPELETVNTASPTSRKAPARSSKRITANLGVGSKLFSGLDQSFHAMREQEVTELELPELDLPVSSSESDLDLAGRAIATSNNQHQTSKLNPTEQAPESSDSVLDFMDLMQLKADPIKEEVKPELDYELPVSIKANKSEDVLRAIESALSQVSSEENKGQVNPAIPTTAENPLPASVSKQDSETPAESLSPAKPAKQAEETSAAEVAKPETVATSPSEATSQSEASKLASDEVEAKSKVADNVQPSHTIPVPHLISLTTSAASAGSTSSDSTAQSSRSPATKPIPKPIPQPHLVAVPEVVDEVAEAANPEVAVAIETTTIPAFAENTAEIAVNTAESALDQAVAALDSESNVASEQAPETSQGEETANFSNIVSLFTDESNSFDLDALDIEDEIFVTPSNNKEEFLSPEQLAIVEYREAIAEEEKLNQELDHEAIAEESKDLAQGVVTDISKIAPIDTLVNLAAVPSTAPDLEQEEEEEEVVETLGYNIPKIPTPITPRFVPNEQQVFDTQVLGTNDSIFIIRIPTKTVDQARMDNVPPEMLADYHRHNGNFEEAARQDAIAASRVIPPPISLDRIIPPPSAVPVAQPKTVAPPNIIAPPSMIPVPTVVESEPEELILALRQAHSLEVIEFEKALTDRQEQVKANLVGEQILPPTSEQQQQGQIYLAQADFNDYDKLTEADLFVNRRSPITDRNKDGWIKHPEGYIPVPRMSKAQAQALVLRSPFIDEEEKRELIENYDEQELDYMLYNHYSPEIAEYSKAFILDFEEAAAEAARLKAEQEAALVQAQQDSLAEQRAITLATLRQDPLIVLTPHQDKSLAYVDFTPVGLDLVELNPSQEVVYGDQLTAKQQQIKTQLAGKLYELPEDDYDLILQENLYIVQDSVPEDEILRDEDRFVNRRSQNGDYNEQGWLVHDQSCLPAPRFLLLSELIPKATGFLRFVLGYGDLQGYFAYKISRLTLVPEVQSDEVPVVAEIAAVEATPTTPALDSETVTEEVTDSAPSLESATQPSSPTASPAEAEQKPSKVIAPPNVNLLLSSAMQLREQMSKGNKQGAESGAKQVEVETVTPAPEVVVDTAETQAPAIESPTILSQQEVTKAEVLTPSASEAEKDFVSGADNLTHEVSHVEPLVTVGSTNPAETVSTAESAQLVDSVEPVDSAKPETTSVESTPSVESPVESVITPVIITNEASNPAPGFSSFLPNAAPLFFTPSTEEAVASKESQDSQDAEVKKAEVASQQEADADKVITTDSTIPEATASAIVDSPAAQAEALALKATSAEVAKLIAKDLSYSKQEQEDLARAYQAIVDRQAEQTLIAQELASAELDRQQLRSEQFAKHLAEIASKAKSGQTNTNLASEAVATRVSPVAEIEATAVQAEVAEKLETNPVESPVAEAATDAQHQEQTQESTQEQVQEQVQGQANLTTEHKQPVLQVQSPFITSGQGLANTFVNPFVTKVK